MTNARTMKAVEKLFDRGLSQREIADRLGVDRKDVSAWLKAMGKPSSREIRAKQARERWARAYALRQEGLTLAEVGAAMGVGKERARTLIFFGARERQASQCD
jgi:orotate phosphoribosyltransferase-like protein